jgi:hypothetical protein
MSYRNKTYVCFDGDTDMRYYRLMSAWKQNDGIEFSFLNAHDLNTARDTSTEETIKRKLRERLSNTKVFVVLIGEKTRYLYKFVRWEMEKALELNLPIIGVNLNGFRKQDIERCPPIIKDNLAAYISFNAAVLQFALENWPQLHENYKRQGKTGPYYYDEDVYKRLGL